jgi:hypothetical protein
VKTRLSSSSCGTLRSRGEEEFGSGSYESKAVESVSKHETIIGFSFSKAIGKGRGGKGRIQEAS